MTIKDVNNIEDRCELLAQDFGLETILEQNDLTDSQMIRILYELGRIDLDDYFYKDMELIPQED